MNSSVGLVSIAILGGAAVALQGQFMGIMDRKIGTSGALFVNYASGVFVAGVIILLLQGGALRNLVQVPWYALTAGLLGLVIAGSIGFTVPRLGLSAAFTIVVATQFVVALILEHYGFFSEARRPIDLTRLAGVGGL
ncbi:MAG: DMT family transporter, partial [Rhizobiaceae bacterium]